MTSLLATIEKMISSSEQNKAAPKAVNDVIKDETVVVAEESPKAKAIKANITAIKGKIKCPCGTAGCCNDAKKVTAISVEGQLTDTMMGSQDTVPK